MSRHTFQTDAGLVVIDTEKDQEIYYAPRNPPNTGSRYTRGTDLSLHRTRKGNKFFYLYHWSMWEGEDDGIEQISEEQAKEFFRRKLVCTGHSYPTDDEIEEAQKIWPDLMEETA